MSPTSRQALGIGILHSDSPKSKHLECLEPNATMKRVRLQQNGTVAIANSAAAMALSAGMIVKPNRKSNGMTPKTRTVLQSICRIFASILKDQMILKSRALYPYTMNPHKVNET